MECNKKGCSKEAIEWIVCSQCFFVNYCSEDCLVSAWEEGHEVDCPGHMFKLKDLRPVSQGSLSTLGKGTYSEVVLYEHKKDKKLYAVKIIEKSIISVNLPIEALFREISLQKNLRHENIIQLYDQLEGRNRIYLILEYASRGNLYEYIKLNPRMTESEAARLFIDICVGVQYLHDNNIMHRDLKPENILLNEFMQAKICDLGWSAYCKKPRKTMCGTLDYMSPEILEGKDYSFPSDIWSLGILLYELLHGKPPFKNSTYNLKPMMECQINIDQNLSQGVKNLIKKILIYNPDRRPCIKDILKSRWIQENSTVSLCVGDKIMHKTHGAGVVMFIQGLICRLCFKYVCMESIIPEVLKEVTFVNDINDEFTMEMLNSTRDDTSIAPKHQKDLKMSGSDFESLVFDTSLISNDLFTANVSIINEEDSKVREREDELTKLQGILEGVLSPKKLIRSATSSSSSGLGLGCLHR
jgi:serine/threonine protein kinase